MIEEKEEGKKCHHRWTEDHVANINELLTSVTYRHSVLFELNRKNLSVFFFDKYVDDHNEIPMRRYLLMLIASIVDRTIGNYC